MYAYIKGKLIQKKPANIIIETAGIGYDILVSMNTYSNLPSQDEETSLLLHFIPREDSHNLYGFYTQDEKDLFLKLISVNGIGPKSAIAILSSINAFEFMKSIVEGNITLLQKIPGIGKKTAERMVVELKDKFKEIPVDNVGNEISLNKNKVSEEAINALITLGYGKTVAEKTIANILKVNQNITDVETLIKLSLKNMM
ncbi:MAG: Holliday junction branch migration protein RuvA [Candidatus Kapaibacteriota bacterium]|jgi:Holliday junction DNA helicase RuvA